jgi:acetyl-CoA acyltransferase 1
MRKWLIDFLDVEFCRAGIDGGGVFKEFFTSLCKEVFDTDRSLWLANKRNEKFKAGILPIKVKVIDPKTDKESEVVVDSDDGIRDGVTAESLGKLKPAFSKTGSTHAGMSYKFCLKFDS